MRLRAALAICLALAAALSLRAQTPLDVSVHDPSTIVKCGAEYWLYATGTGVVSKHSRDLIHWESGPRVLSVFPEWTTRVVPGHNGHFWAPDIIQLHGRFLLYYSVSKWGVNTSAIGLASNTTLDPADAKYRWVDAGVVIQTTARDNYNAIDPCVTTDADGGLWLAFGSYWSGIKLLQLDPATGLRRAADSPVHALAWHDSIEAPCLFRHGQYYYLFVNWGQCCRGVNSTYNIRMGRSARITGPYTDKQGVDLLRAGGSLLRESSGRFIGPGHPGVLSTGDADWLSYHYYDGQRRGRPILAIQRLEWDAQAWPVLKNAVGE